MGSAAVFWNGPKLVQAKASQHFLGKDAEVHGIYDKWLADYRVAQASVGGLHSHPLHMVVTLLRFLHPNVGVPKTAALESDGLWHLRLTLGLLGFAYLLVRLPQFPDATDTLRVPPGHFNLAIRLADSLQPQETLKLPANPSLSVTPVPSSPRDPAPRSVQFDKAAVGAVDLQADGEGWYSVTSDHPLVPVGAHEDTCGFGKGTLARKLTLGGAHTTKVEFSLPCAVRVKRDDGAIADAVALALWRHHKRHMVCMIHGPKTRKGLYMRLKPVPVLKAVAAIRKGIPLNEQAPAAALYKTFQKAGHSGQSIWGEKKRKRNSALVDVESSTSTSSPAEVQQVTPKKQKKFAKKQRPSADYDLPTGSSGEEDFNDDLGRQLFAPPAQGHTNPAAQSKINELQEQVDCAQRQLADMRGAYDNVVTEMTQMRNCMLEADVHLAQARCKVNVLSMQIMFAAKELQEVPEGMRLTKPIVSSSYRSILPAETIPVTFWNELQQLLPIYLKDPDYEPSESTDA